MKKVHQIQTFAKVLRINCIGEQFQKNWVLNENGNLATLVTTCFNAQKDKNFSREVVLRAAGGINGNKIIENTYNTLCNPIRPSTFLASLDLEGFGEKKLSVFDSMEIDDILHITTDLLLQMEGWSSISANDFLTELVLKKDVIKELLKVVKVVPIVSNQSSKNLEGKSFCFTGTLHTMKRNEAELLVTQHGGKISSVGKNLTYLVTNDPNTNTGKGKKARELGIQIISETDFLKLL